MTTKENTPYGPCLTYDNSLTLTMGACPVPKSRFSDSAEGPAPIRGRTFSTKPQCFPMRLRRPGPRDQAVVAIPDIRAGTTFATPRARGPGAAIATLPARLTALGVTKIRSAMPRQVTPGGLTAVIGCLFGRYLPQRTPGQGRWPFCDHHGEPPSGVPKGPRACTAALSQATLSLTRLHAALAGPLDRPSA